MSDLNFFPRQFTASSKADLNDYTTFESTVDNMNNVYRTRGCLFVRVSTCCEKTSRNLVHIDIQLLDLDLLSKQL